MYVFADLVSFNCVVYITIEHALQLLPINDNLTPKNNIISILVPVVDISHDIQSDLSTNISNLIIACEVKQGNLDVNTNETEEDVIYAASILLQTKQGL